MDMSAAHGTVAVGVDGSDPGGAALAWASHQAGLEGRTVAVVHACGLPGAIQDFEDVVANERGLMSVGRSIAREAVNDVREVDPTLGVSMVVGMGHAEQVLLEVSETAHLLVVGARGRGTVSRALLGSVSARIARESMCPVVIVRETPGSRSHRPELPVVVGVDGTAVSSAAVEFAFHMASVRRAPLTVMHATWDLREQVSPVMDLRSLHEKVNLGQEERLMAETIAGLCEKYPELAVTESCRRGEPVRRLVEASREASLVVVGTRGRRLRATTLLGSVSRGVAERALCPVAVVRP